jgi:hypothetical protein
VDETGDGGDTSQSDNYKLGMSTRDTSGTKNPMYGRSAIVEQNIRWYNNGTENKYVKAGTEPAGYVLGRIINYKKPHSAVTKQKISRANKKPDRPCISPSGEIFANPTLAGQSVGISAAGIAQTIKRGISGWRWL